MTCLQCLRGKLHPKFHIEVLNAYFSDWRPRLTCRACFATGFHDPATGAWVFFDNVAPDGVRDRPSPPQPGAGA